VCPVRVLRSAPSGSDQSLTVLSSLPEASNRPSGLIARLVTSSEWARAPVAQAAA